MGKLRQISKEFGFYIKNITSKMCQKMSHHLAIHLDIYPTGHNHTYYSISNDMILDKKWYDVPKSTVSYHPTQLFFANIKDWIQLTVHCALT